MSQTVNLTAWAGRHGITVKDAKELRILLKHLSGCGVRLCNGDPHPRVKTEDKEVNSMAWAVDEKILASMLIDLAKHLGFDGVNFTVGLYPALIKGNDTCIMVP